MQHKTEWRPPDEERPFRTCSYCGSIHPEDLLQFAAADHPLGFEVADMKYGWPHKVYVTGIPPRGHAKFYTEHLRDEGIDDEAFDAVGALLETRTGISFVRREGRLLWARVV